MKLTKEAVHKLWSTGEIFTHDNGRKYIMHKMSYGDYFLEPSSWRGGEKDGFAPCTIWGKKYVDKKTYSIPITYYRF